MDPSQTNGRHVPGEWHQRIDSRLERGEVVLAWFLPDLNLELRYAESLVVLTNRRLLCFAPAETAADAFRSWRIEDIASIKARDRSGLGCLEFFDRRGLAAHWRYTVARAAAARRLASRFQGLAQGERQEEESWDDAGAQAEEASLAQPRSSVLLRLIRFARPRAGLIALGFVLTLGATAAGLVPPHLTGLLIDDVLTPYQYQVADVERANVDAQNKTEQLAELKRSNRDSLARGATFYLGGIAVAAVLTWVLTWGQGIVMAWASERIAADLRNHTYAHLQRLSLEFFGGKRTGDLLSRISTDTERICYFLSDNLVDFSTDVLMIVGTAAILFWRDPMLALAALVPLPLIAYLVFKARDHMQRGFQRGGRAWGEMTSILADTIPGIRVVKAFAQEKREIERFGRANDLIVRANDRVNVVWTFFWPLVALLNQFGLLIVWLIGAWLIYDQQIQLGVLIEVLTYITRIYTRLESMSRMLSNTQRAAAGAQRVFEILDRIPSVPDPARPRPVGRLRGEIEFRNVSFRHGSRTVIENLSLSIQPQEMIGLVGPSGAGKSTLVNLVCRFYDVAEGAILVDGVDIRSFAVEDYRRHIGVVLQDPFLFYGTVAENIAYGRPAASRQEIIAAAKAARAHDFILRLPLGYDSLVGERGQSLSGGERQRISIARALLIDPQILILDEATSSVDTETEREIQLALDHLVQGRTTIAIAHRLSTLRKADRLVVLERGRIVEMGQHPDLIRAGGVYARLHEAQQQHAAEIET